MQQAIQFRFKRYDASRYPENHHERARDHGQPKVDFENQTAHGSILACNRGDFLLPPHSQCICHAIDVVEPRGDQRDLQNAPIIEAHGAQAFDVVLPHPGRIFCQSDDVVDHDALLWRDRRGGVVLLQRLYQFFI